jgi:hypothetical protein
MKRHPNEPRRWFTAAAVATAAVIGIAAFPQPASAYTLQSTVNCSDLTWSGPPEIQIHYGDFQGNFVEVLQMVDAVIDVNDQFNLVGATTAAVTTVTSTNDTFTFANWFNDVTPTIHIGFTNSMPNNAIGRAQIGPTPIVTCQHDEAHIEFLDVDNHDWNFSTPSLSGEDYYETGKTDDSGATYFRHSYVHELLHTFGLAHTVNGYAAMNYGDRGWANRPGDDAVRPLPDDVEALRDLYPAAGTRTEVALYNTWYDPARVTNGAATQDLLCEPSLGTSWNADRFASRCGTGGAASGSTTVCAGNTLRTRFALANFSTDSVDVDARLWFSTDDVYQWSDTISATAHTFTVSANGSTQQGRTWTVPALGAAGTTYHVLARVVATTSTGAVVGDWIPLRGTVTAC